MTRLIITADIHGIYSGWEKIKDLLQPDDILIVAGDLCGTRFPKPDDPNYQPEKIRDEFRALKNKKYIVSGNCDIPAFFPGLKKSENFTFAGKKILLIHGDEEYAEDQFDIIIFGHTHVPFLKTISARIHLNPGSPSKPRGFVGKELVYTYAVFDGKTIQIIDLKNNKIVYSI